MVATPFRDDLYSYMGGIIRGEGGVSLQIGGISDHVHLFVKLKPAIAVSDLYSDSSRPIPRNG